MIDMKEQQTPEHGLKCTECGKKGLSNVHQTRWSSAYGFIIKDGESLCDYCAEKREGFKTLKEIHDDRAKAV